MAMRMDVVASETEDLLNANQLAIRCGAGRPLSKKINKLLFSVFPTGLKQFSNTDCKMIWMMLCMVL